MDVDRYGRVQGAIVWIDGEPAPKKLPVKEVRLDQKGCLFVPNALVATVGSTLVVSSSDPLLHNVHIKDEKGATFANFSMPVMGQEAKIALKKPGVFSVRCEAGHEWMRAGIVVLEHARFGVSGVTGEFTLRDVAPGPHRVIAFHPELGRVEKTIVAGEGNVPVHVDLTF